MVMKANNVSVSVFEAGGKLYVQATFTLPGSLEKDTDSNIAEGSRKRKQKEIQRLLEEVEFANVP